MADNDDVFDVIGAGSRALVLGAAVG